MVGGGGVRGLRRGGDGDGGYLVSRKTKNQTGSQKSCLPCQPSVSSPLKLTKFEN